MYKCEGLLVRFVKSVYVCYPMVHNGTCALKMLLIDESIHGSNGNYQLWLVDVQYERLLLAYVSLNSRHLLNVSSGNLKYSVWVIYFEIKPKEVTNLGI